MSVFGNELEKMMKYVDILFGNNEEVLAHAELKQWQTKRVDEIATKIVEDAKVRPEVGKIVIVTQGE